MTDQMTDQTTTQPASPAFDPMAPQGAPHITKLPVPDKDAGKFLVLNRTMSKGAHQLVWFKHRNSGFTTDLMQAGRYTQNDIDAAAALYNDGEKAQAVPIEQVFGGTWGPIVTVVAATIA